MPGERSTKQRTKTGRVSSNKMNKTVVVEVELVTRHRLQAFSEDYFQPGGRLFSYSQDNCRASGAVLQARTGPPEFCVICAPGTFP